MRFKWFKKEISFFIKVIIVCILLFTFSQEWVVNDENFTKCKSMVDEWH